MNCVVGPLLAVTLALTPLLDAGEALKPVSLTALQWRSIGPLRGGRSIACAGIPSRPDEYYFGATGGGLWKTTDGGTSWDPVTDGQIASSSVGAVAVAPSNPDVVYIGMGESQLRGNVMQGDGVYRSTDGGRTWTHAGLADTLTIARIRVHPEDPRLVYAAALGDPTQASAARGVYRSRDGGLTWQKVLFRDELTGAVDLALDPKDPMTVYAALWQVYRIPWQLSSGGPGSGLFKSRDGGETWAEITRAPGLPKGVIGKIGIAVSGADSRRLFAVIEAKEGGLYRSDDAGASWTIANRHRDLWQRAFYFNRVVADPKDRDTVYILNFILARSTDAGATYTVIEGPHVDYHDMWIDPGNPARLVASNDGGASVSVNAGKTWTSQRYPTAQMYRVETTADVPYHVVASQQDNSSVAIPSSQGGHSALPRQPPGSFFYEVGGGESGWVAPHPARPDLFFAGATNYLSRFDRRTAMTRDVQPWPRLVMGEPARDMPERWNWTYPIVISPLPPYALYAGSQHVWRSRDDGQTWDRISPDLTRADPATLGDSGGPIILDQDGPEVYGTVFALAPSRREPDTVWAGSDDGLVHVTRNGGTTWAAVTPPALPAHSRISVVEASPHAPGRAYIAVKRNQLGDRQPYLFKTEDYGAHWKRIDAGLPRHDFAHVIREDHTRPGLLYVGSEHGLYVSFDDGEAWHSLRLNLPDVHVPDLKVEKHDLVIATHGRSFHVLDAVAPLRQWNEGLAARPFHLFRPEPTYRGAPSLKIDFLIGKPAEGARIEILDSTGSVVREIAMSGTLAAGHHRREWTLRTRGATVFPGMILEAPNPSAGVRVPPGAYQVRLSVSGVSQIQPVTVAADPRLPGDESGLAEQFALAMRLRDGASAANEAVIRIRALKSELADAPSALQETARALASKLTAVEAELYQIRNQSPKDKIANPIKLNDRLAGLLASVEEGEGAPTAGQHAVAKELLSDLDRRLTTLGGLLTGEVAAFDDRLAAAGGKRLSLP